MIVILVTFLVKKKTLITFSFFRHIIMLRFFFVKNKWNEFIVKNR